MAPPRAKGECLRAFYHAVAASLAATASSRILERRHLRARERTTFHHGSSKCKETGRRSPGARAYPDWRSPACLANAWRQPALSRRCRERHAAGGYPLTWPSLAAQCASTLCEPSAIFARSSSVQARIPLQRVQRISVLPEQRYLNVRSRLEYA